MIDSSLPFFWIATTAALLLLGLLAYAEWRRYGTTGRFYLRLLLLLVALSALYLTFVKPTYQARGAAVTVLANHAPEPVLDSLLEVYPTANVLSLQPHKRYQQIEGLSYLHRYVPAQSQLFVVGKGLPEQQLSFLEPYQLFYLPDGRQQNIVQLAYNSSTSVADSLLVTGSWIAPAPSHKLLLALGSLVLDSVTSEQAGLAPFALQTALPFAGRRVYRLYQLSAKGDTLEEYHLPLQVREAQPHQLALLTAYPEAETKYLKEWLGQQAYATYYMAELSPGVAVREWMNLPRKPFYFNQEALKQWDMLLMSAGYYVSLADREEEVLQQTIWAEGSGLMLMADEEVQKLSWQGSSLLFAPELQQDTLQLGMQRVPVSYRPLRQLPEGWQILLQGEKGIISIGRRWGLGQVVVSGLASTYPLLLKGNHAAYEQLWSYQLQQLLPPSEKQAQWQAPVSAAVHQPLALSLYTADSLTQVVVRGPEGEELPLVFWQSPAKPQYWLTKFWPQLPGWYTAIAPGDTLHFRVASEPSPLLNNQQQTQMSHLAARQPAEAFVLPAGSARKPYSQWLYFAFFLTGMGGLWLEKKLNG